LNALLYLAIRSYIGGDASKMPVLKDLAARF